MCGIAGIVHYGRSESVSRDVLARMNDAMTHRGPDDAGVFVDGNVGLAMRRLSIIDVAGGHQPMKSDDANHTIVFNGEIYNFQQLRDDLRAKGHSFQSSSDTEVLLRLYAQYGNDCVHHLRGMFAFAIWDKRAEKLFVARDRFGKKPFVYQISDGRFAFASELQALVTLPWVSKEIDLEAVDLYLSLQYIPSPWSIYRSVRKLPPAHTLTLEKGKFRVERYWAPPTDGKKLSLSLAEAEFKIVELLKESTRLRMISDVPLGAFLSGGLDSTCIVGIMSQLTDKPVKTFSIGFEEDEFSELPYARQAAHAFGTDHTEFIVKPDMADVLPKLAQHYGEPFGDCSAFATYFLARETRRKVTVALNGDGGDENFAGYRRYVPMKWDFLASAKLYLNFIGIFKTHQKESLYKKEIKEVIRPNLAAGYFDSFLQKSNGLDRVNRWLNLDLQTYLPECLMTKVDIATMANSLEGRSPLLDHVFVEFVARLRGDWKLKGLTQSKWIFKRAFQNLIPRPLLARKKMGFGIPLKTWFQKDLKNLWSEAVLSSESLSQRFFNRSALEQMFREHVENKKDHGYRLWNLLMLEYWRSA